ncbi:MAG: tail protein X, partial [Elusimicrobiota bacterium]|nr:tail protein X [Endomicrobiia bacterium]MDW8166848.1 tail protein X [Elusimicrobiota bacterium]
IVKRGEKELWYLTRDGLRWDTLAYEVYGNPYMYEILLKANPELREYKILPSGKVVKVPILEEEDVREEIKAPWQID